MVDIADQRKEKEDEEEEGEEKEKEEGTDELVCTTKRGTRGGRETE